jgi:poly(3-hydroxyalkanoate) synthetase
MRRVAHSPVGRTFAWMRPDDLVFDYLVNNWLLGDDPPSFDAEPAPGMYVHER